MRRLFLVLLLLYIGAVLSQHIGSFIFKELSEQGGTISSWSSWVSITLFLAITIGLRKWDFRKIFLGSLGGSGLLLLFSLLFRKSEIGFILSAQIVARFLPVLGWAYVNQMTSSLQASKKYFLLHFLVGVAITPFTFLPQIGSSSLYFWSLVCSSLICLVWAITFFLLDEQIADKEEKTDPIWPHIPTLALLLTGMQLILAINNPIIEQKMLCLAKEQGPYLSQFMMGRSVTIVSILTLLLSSLSIWIGPLVLRHKSRSYAILGAVLVAAITTILTYSCENLYFFSFYKAILGCLQYFWMFPLIQIACSRLNREKQFPIQIAVFLVAAPLIEVLSTHLSLGGKGALFGSLIILVAMTFGEKSLYAKNPAVVE